MLCVNSDKASTGVAETNKFVNNETSPQATVSMYFLGKQMHVCAVCSMQFGLAIYITLRATV
jgi:TRAP-type mannitol/chloroaromatic compound transport system substrate-binding protein